MTNKLFSFVLSLGLTVLVLACASKKEEGSSAADQKEWKEMDDFHMVMAETFHPYKDSANLEPAKSRAGELVAAAEKWAGATLPEKVNTDEMRDKLAILKSETSTLVTTVAGADDKAIGDQLTKVHDLFHSIQEDWYGGGEGHEEHH
jgi:hypothetical protein